MILVLLQLPHPARSVLKCVAVCITVRCSVLQCVEVCCSVLQCVAVCCSVLKCAVEPARKNALVLYSRHVQLAPSCVCVYVCVCVSGCSDLACCSGLQYLAVRYSVLQYVAVCCVLQCVAVCCSVM